MERQERESPSSAYSGELYSPVGWDERAQAAMDLELSIVDDDIASVYRGLDWGNFVSGDAARLQIARSLRRLVQIKEGGDGHDGRHHRSDRNDNV